MTPWPTQDTVTQLISVIRWVRRLIPEAAAVEVSAHDYDHATKPVIAWDVRLAKHGWSPPWSTTPKRSSPPLETCRLVTSRPTPWACWPWSPARTWSSGDTPSTWRIAQRVAPDRVIPTVDPEARHAHKSPSQRRDGYKAHVGVESETGLITDARLTPANAPDGAIAVGLVHHEAEPVEFLDDSAYGSGPTRAALAARGH